MHQAAGISQSLLGRSNSSWKQVLGMFRMTYYSILAQIIMKLICDNSTSNIMSEIPHFNHHVLQGSGLLVLAEADVEVAGRLRLLHQDRHQLSLPPASRGLQLLAAHCVWRNSWNSTHNQLWEKIHHLQQTVTHLVFRNIINMQSHVFNMQSLYLKLYLFNTCNTLEPIFHTLVHWSILQVVTTIQFLHTEIVC